MTTVKEKRKNTTESIDMKQILTIIIVLSILSSRGQLNVGVKTDSLTIVQIDTLIEGNPTYPGSLNIDLDNNGLPDIRLYIYVAGGGDGTAIESRLYSYDDTRIITDTVKTPIINDYGDTTYMYVHCPVKLDSNQIIYKSDYTDTLSYLSWYSKYQGIVYINLNHWIDNQIHFVGFIKKINGDDYLGWIKIRVELGFRIHLYELAMQDHTLNIPEKLISIDVLSTTYFNLLGQQIDKPTKGFYIERKVTNKGIISTKHFIQ